MTTGKSERDSRKPILEWVAAGIGLMLTLAMLGFLAWKAVDDSGGAPPSVSVHAGAVTPVANGYLVEIVATNSSSRTAAGVEVEGRIRQQGRSPATSTLSFDYIPGRSSRRGGMFFEQDPASGEFQARALGYTEP